MRGARLGGGLEDVADDPPGHDRGMILGKVRVVEVAIRGTLRLGDLGPLARLLLRPLALGGEDLLDDPACDVGRIDVR